MTTLQFEHPLNEKARTYLRVEALFDQLFDSIRLDSEFQHQLFFRSLFDFLDISEQSQLKNDLGKDIDKQRSIYSNWLHYDGVDQEALTNLLQEIDRVQDNLSSADLLGLALKEDRFLSAIRQRCSLPGGTCSFDLPALHYWLHLSIEEKSENIQKWMHALRPLGDALKLWLRLLRESSSFNSVLAKSGSYQSSTEDSNFLRLRVQTEYGVYPMISGYRNRFSIRFVTFSSGQTSDDTIEFTLAVC